VEPFLAVFSFEGSDFFLLTPASRSATAFFSAFFSASLSPWRALQLSILAYISLPPRAKG
jgi:hypothetical protein